MKFMSSQHLTGSLAQVIKHQFFLQCVALDKVLAEATESHCGVFSSRISMSVFSKTIPSVPTPGYFTLSRTSVDSIPDAGKDESSWHAHGENRGTISCLSNS